jgi:hypothetical protein
MYTMELMEDELGIKAKDVLTQGLTEAIREWEMPIKEFKESGQWTTYPWRSLNQIESELNKDPNRTCSAWAKGIHG